MWNSRDYSFLLRAFGSVALMQSFFLFISISSSEYIVYRKEQGPLPATKLITIKRDARVETKITQSTLRRDVLSRLTTIPICHLPNISPIYKTPPPSIRRLL
jgi:hypothetical protein